MFRVNSRNAIGSIIVRFQLQEFLQNNPLPDLADLESEPW